MTAAATDLRAPLSACPNCGGPRDEPTLRFCVKCRRVVL